MPERVRLGKIRSRHSDRYCIPRHCQSVSIKTSNNALSSQEKQAVCGRPPRYAPPLYAARCDPVNSSPYTPYAWPAAPSAPCFQ